MYYFLQSIPKVKELIATGLYQLDGKLLIEKATKEAV
jgi:hypothetical protein